MPQLDISTYISQIFWLLIIFPALYFVCLKIIIPRLAAIFSEREIYISEALVEAKHISNQALELEKENSKKIAEAYAKSTIEINNAIAEFELHTKKMLDISQEKMIDHQESSAKKLDLLKIDLQDSIEKLVNESTILFAKEVAKVNISDNELKKLISKDVSNNVK